MLHLSRHHKFIGAAIAGLAFMGFFAVASCSIDDGKLKIKLTPHEAAAVGIDVAVIPDADTPAPPAWSTKDRKILRNGEPFQVRGLSWFGFETNDYQLHGLWVPGSTVWDYLDQIKSLGFNALRIPIAPEVLDFATLSNGNWGDQGSKQWARSQLLNLLAMAHQRNLPVLFDVHNTASYRKLIGKLDPPRYGKEEWLDTLRNLALISTNYPGVMGIDLLNEPWDYTWEEWAPLAEAGGNAILEVNPDLLIFVEGVGNKESNDPDPYFWGENLSGAAARPINLRVSDRVVYSPHVYGPSVAKQPYFDLSQFPHNMRNIWGRHFLWPIYETGAPMVIGEWGGRFTDKDKVWADALVDQMHHDEKIDNFFWCFNPNSSDTGGILKDDWKTVDEDKMALVRRSWGWK